ncbi:Protein phosphatase 2C 6 [Ceratocystis pirilliformis]|uniref:Protein phosphatase 2C 6 n=1 Tax=Ceratocystis pirilliformis TaxID=259994 RepID=A0ABR3ZIB1_9PEZI
MSLFFCARRGLSNSCQCPHPKRHIAENCRRPSACPMTSHSIYSNFSAITSAIPVAALPVSAPSTLELPSQRRFFHDYFVTHLPSSSMHPDSRSGPGHRLPRHASTPHSPQAQGQTPNPEPAPALPPNISNRDLTVVRIPLRRAKHHFGHANNRGTRPYNEDTNTVGTVSIPAFAKRGPISVQLNTPEVMGEATNADSAYGDPQVFYFGVFDGHGGTQCSNFLRDELHGYIEEAAVTLGLQSSLKKSPTTGSRATATASAIATRTDDNGLIDPPVDPLPLCKDLVQEYKQAIGGYFRRFVPRYFVDMYQAEPPIQTTIESVLMYSFLRADLDFVKAQARLPEYDSVSHDRPLNSDEYLGEPNHVPPSGHGIGTNVRFKGGSTASIAMVSTPTPAPFWHPKTSSTMIVAHVGDTRVLLCETLTGQARPVTSDHRPSMPSEERRLRRYAPATSLVSGDSFGEERIAGLANSRAFGDVQSKRIGVSAEPDITRIEMGPAEYSFFVLVSDGVSGTLSDQEIVDVVKEAKTPEQGAQDIVDYATEVSSNGDNATCLVVRLGGWERRQEGGVGSFGTKEIRDVRRSEAMNPRMRRQ